MSWIESVRAFYGDDIPRPPAAAAPVNGTAADTDYGMAALTEECARVAAANEGTRDDAINTAAFRMGQLVGGGQLTERTARDNLHAAARMTGQPENEIRRALRDNETGGFARGMRQPRGPVERPPATPAAAVEEPDPGPVSDDVEFVDNVRRLFPLLDWHGLFADDEEEEWIVEPILPARRLVALYSAPKVGKSLLMLEIAVAVARGTAVLGTKVDRPRRVLYVDFENDPKGDIRERLLDMCLGPDDLADLAYLSFPTLAALDSPRGGSELLATVAVYRCEVVVIDTVSRSVAGPENDNDTWLAFYRHTGVALKRLGVSLVRLDHTGKDETKGQRGGSAKSGDVDMVWRLSRVTDEVFRLDCEAARMAVAEKTVVLHRESGPLRHRVDANGRAAAWDAKVRAVIEAMDAAELPDDAGAERGRQVARAAGVKARNEVVAAAVKARKQRFGPVPKIRGQVGSEHLSPSLGDRWGQVPADEE